MSSAMSTRSWRHHSDAIGEKRGFRDRVGDEQHRRAEGFAQPAQEMSHVGAGHLVERGERLVHQQDRCVDGERPNQPHSLLHPAGEFVRVGVAEVAEADLVEEIADRCARCRRRRASVDVEQQAGVRFDGAPREQRRRLGHEADLLVASGLGRRHAVDDDLARRRLFEAGDQAQQGGLAAARRPEERDRLAVTDVEVDRCKRVERPERLRDAAHFDPGRHDERAYLRGGAPLGPVRASVVECQTCP